MASRNFSNIQSITNQTKLLVGSFAPNGSGVPTVSAGLGFSVSRSATGTFHLVPRDPYFKILSCDAQLSAATSAGVVATKTIVGGSSPNGDVLLTATTLMTGPAGNGITITTLGGTSQSLAVSGVGLDITVQLHTDGGGAVLTTGGQLTTAINGDASASLLVVASNPGTGASISAAHAKANLTGGGGTTVQAQVGAITGINSATPLIIIRTVDNTGTAVDVAADAASIVSFVAYMQNESQA